MPANLSADYKAAEAKFRSSREPQDRLDALREMLRLIPKHKGTEHLQADIKSRMKELTTELAAPRKGAARTGPATVIRLEGAAQVALIGPPNSGKSALHAALTGSHSLSAPYPFATQYPQPGMLPVNDVTIQLIDLPSISGAHPILWLANSLQPADAALLVIDLAAPGCVEAMIEIHDFLAERRVHLVPRWPADGVSAAELDDPFAQEVPCAIVAAKAEIVSGIDDELEALAELSGRSYPAMVVSAETGEGLDQVGPWLFQKLGIVRVYTKMPGGQPDLTRPFTVRSGDTVIDVAELVHRDFVTSFKYARVWGHSGFDGQQVGREHVVEDGDVIEIHS